MPSFFNNLSIRNKLIVLIGGTVSLLTASVLGLVWMQSLKQARSIVQEQLDNSRLLFDSAQQARYRAFAFETASERRAGRHDNDRRAPGPGGSVRAGGSLDAKNGEQGAATCLDPPGRRHAAGVRD